MLPPRVRQLIEALDDVELILRACKGVRVNGANCMAYYDGMVTPPRIVVALRHPKHKSADDLVLTVVHELLHQAGFEKEQQAYALEKPYYTSQKLREAILTRLVNVGILKQQQFCP